MARIQVLRLPPIPGDSAPFALIIDKSADWEFLLETAEELARIAKESGARTVIVVAETLDVG